MAGANPDDQPTGAIQFSSIEDMQAATEDAGWDAQYRQLQAGQLLTRAYSREYADISLLDEFASKSIEVTGKTPVDCSTVLMPIEGPQCWANGLTAGHTDLIVLDPDSQLHFVTGDNCRVLSMHLPLGMLQGMVHASDVGGVRGYKGSAMLQLGARDAAALQRLLFCAIHQQAGSSGGWNAEVAGLLKDRVAKILETYAMPDPYKERSSVTESHRVIKCAREYIEENLSDRISLSDISAHCIVSVSKLERTFRRDLGLTPGQYIKARRLATVYQRLKILSRDEGKVADIAMDFGFNHLGRFAGAYRAQFGELPSDTLQTPQISYSPIGG